MFNKYEDEGYLSNFIGKFGYKMSEENIVRNVILAAIENGYNKLNREIFLTINVERNGVRIMDSEQNFFKLEDLLKDEEFIYSLAKINTLPNLGRYNEEEYNNFIEDNKNGLVLELKDLLYNNNYTKIINDLFIFILTKNIILKIINKKNTHDLPDITIEDYNNIINSLYFKEAYVIGKNYDKKASYSKKELQINNKGELNYIK